MQIALLTCMPAINKIMPKTLRNPPTQSICASTSDLVRPAELTRGGGK